jgi:hypothetical protein
MCRDKHLAQLIWRASLMTPDNQSRNAPHRGMPSESEKGNFFFVGVAVLLNAVLALHGAPAMKRRTAPQMSVAIIPHPFGASQAA